MRIVLGIIIAALIGLSAGPTFAQVKFGAAAGLNWTGLGDVDLGSVEAAYESHTGWHSGIFADLSIGPIALKPGLYYVNAGPLFQGGLEDAEGDFEELTSFDYTYISLPVDVIVGLPLPMLKPYLLLGPEFKFSTVSSDAGEIAEQLQSTVVAGNAGIGVALTLSGFTLYPELRLAFDISGIFGDEFTVGGQEFMADSHNAGAFFVRLGVGI